MAKVLNDTFGIAEGVINTVHAYTNDQRLADVPHSDWRRSRAAAENIIPTSTGAAKAVGEVLLISQGGCTALPRGSPCQTDQWSICSWQNSRQRSPQKTFIRPCAALRAHPLAGILEYSDVPIVSSDIIGNAHSSIYDSGFTAVSQKRYVRALNWYDNDGVLKSSLRSAGRHRPLVILSPSHSLPESQAAARMLFAVVYRLIAI